MDDLLLPLQLMFQCEIEEPLDVSDISEAMLIANTQMFQLQHDGGTLSTTEEVDDFIDQFITSMHCHFDLQSEGVVGNLQLRSIVATVTKVVASLHDDPARLHEDVFRTISDGVVEMYVRGADEDEYDDVAVQQIKLRLAGMAPSYRVGSSIARTKQALDEFCKDVISSIDD